MKKARFIIIVLLLSSSIVAQVSETNYAIIGDSINPKYSKPHFLSIIGPTVLVGKYRMGFGVNFTGFQYDPKRKVFTGISFGYEQLSNYDTFKKEQGDLTLRSGQFGFHVFPKLSKRFFLRIGVMVQGGQEIAKYKVPFMNWASNSYIEKEERTWMFGFAPSQGISFIPMNHAGITLSLSFYQRVFTMDYYRYDIGGMLSIGIRF